jgi:hypothetical protein
MAVDPANAHELAQIAGEVGANVLSGNLRYPSDTGGWQLGDIDLSEYLDRYRGQKVMVGAPLGQAPVASYTCGVCGFVYNERGECPRCRLAVKGETESVAEGGDILDQVDELLRGIDNDGPFDDVR